MSLRRKLAALAIANLLAAPFMSGLVHADILQTNQDRTVVTLDVPAPSCTSVIDDTLTGSGANGTDLGYHDEDDSVAFDGPNAAFDGFDQTGSSDPDFSDSLFSDLNRDGTPLSDLFDASMNNIVVDDPDAAVFYSFETDGDESDGSGYVDLEQFDDVTNSYAAEFLDHIQCSTASGYDLHIADTFNIDPSPASGNVIYSNAPGAPLYDIDLESGSGAMNLNHREGLFRIAPDSQRDLTDTDLTVGQETAIIKHEYIMDLPSYSCITDVLGNPVADDTWDNGCPSAGLDPTDLTNGLRYWPYDFVLSPNTSFGTVGFTLLCDEDGDQGATALAGTGRINPWTRGLSNPDDPLVQGNMFREQPAGGVNDDCDQLPTKPVWQGYAAIPSLIDGRDYDGVSGSSFDPTLCPSPGAYCAIMSANNWVGRSGFISGPLPAFPSSTPPGTPADNYFEVRANVPDNQTAGTYAGTIILSCLPSMVDEADFDGDGISDDPTEPVVQFQLAPGTFQGITYTASSVSGDEDVLAAAAPIYLNVKFSNVPPVSGTVSYTVIDNTATYANNDFTDVSGTIYVVAGQQNYTIDVSANVVADATIEPNEDYAIELTSTTYGSIGSNYKTTIFINNDDV